MLYDVCMYVLRFGWVGRDVYFCVCNDDGDMKMVDVPCAVCVVFLLCLFSMSLWWMMLACEDLDESMVRCLVAFCDR